MTDVVATLLNVDVGDEVVLEAESYQWSKPYAVDAIDEERWAAAAGDDWIARRLELVPEDGRMTERSLDIVEGVKPPIVTESYGRLTGVELVTAEDADGQAGESDERGELSDAEIHAAIDDYEYLIDVAGELGITKSEARTLVFQLNRYDELSEGSKYNGSATGSGRGRMVVWDGVIVMVIALTVMAVWAIAVMLAGGV